MTGVGQGNLHLPSENDWEASPESIDEAILNDEREDALHNALPDEDEQLAAKISAVSYRRRSSLADGISQDEEEAEGWITSYMDVITLLLAFFVMLLAIANFDPPTPGGAILDSLSLPVENAVGLADDAAGMPTDARLAARLERLATILRESADARLLRSGDLTITVVNEMVVVDISGPIMFDEGAVTLSDAGNAVVDNVALQLALARFFVGQQPYVTVEGHTDDRPVQAAAFASNWELSSARAAGVVRRMIDQGVAAERLRAVGYAHLHPRASNKTPEGRANNRRVTVIIHEAGQTGRAAGQF